MTSTASNPNDPCIFCHLDRPVLVENDRARAFFDAYPVSPGHTLVTPKTHVRTIFDASAEDFAACFELVRALKTHLDAEFAPDGYNVGVNCEPSGGQSVWHAHIHVIPRFAGDVAEPLGGVRNVIPRDFSTG